MRERRGKYSAHAGFTVLEVLVVFVLFSLMATMAFQVAGNFAIISGKLTGSGEALRKQHLAESWFRRVVGAAVVPGTGAGTLVYGDSLSITLITISALTGPVGQPRKVAWRVYDSGPLGRKSAAALFYEESPTGSAGADPVRWQVLPLAPQNAPFFSYISASGMEYSVWPPRESAVSSAAGNEEPRLALVRFVAEGVAIDWLVAPGL